MFTHLDEAFRQQSPERTILRNGEIIAEVAWLTPNRVNASTEDLMMKCVKAAKKGLSGAFRPAPGGLEIVISGENFALPIPVKSLVDAYLSAAGKPEERQKAVAAFVRLQIGEPE